MGNFELTQIASSDSVVDAKREKQQITGPPGKQLFDGLNMGQFSDWLKVCAQGQIAQPPRSACDDRWGCAMAYGLCINKYFYCHALSHDVRLSKVFSLLKPVGFLYFRAAQAVFLWFRIFEPAGELRQSSAGSCRSLSCR